MRFTPKDHLDITKALLEIHRNDILTGNEKTVLAEIFYRCYKSNHCWPSQLTLSECTGLKQSHISRAIQGLESKKMIEKVLDGRKLKYYVLAHHSYLPAAKKKAEWVHLCVLKVYQNGISDIPKWYT